MSSGWRTLSFVLGVACCWQTWRACNRPAPAVTQAECAPIEAPRERDRGNEHRERATSHAVSAAAPDGSPVFGMKLPSWTRPLLPQPGEDLRAYRDRMIPLAQLAVAPQRSRVARSSDDFARAVNLDERQRAELDAAVSETATAIQDRVFDAVLSGDLMPASFKPMAGVAVARDVLDLVDRGNKRFVSQLREDQRGALAKHPFDFADYLLFSTKWEDAISGL